MHEVREWKHPECYMGATWNGWFSSGFGRSRDSDTLEESNFETAWKALEPLQNPEGITDGLETEVTDIRIIREGHWAVGWVEWIAIHGSNTVALDKARELCDRANDYPILDESDYSEREWESACSFWEGMSVRERVDTIQRKGRGTVSVFAARRDSLPEDPNGYLYEYLTTP